MTYNAPELILVGAAQNVVHAGSTGGGSRKLQLDCGEEENSLPDIYNPAGLW